MLVISIFVSFVVYFSFCQVHDPDDLVLTQSIIDDINSKQTLWRADFNSFFEGLTFRDLERYHNPFLDESYMLQEKLDLLRENPDRSKYKIRRALPESYDFRTEFPQCVKDARNQGSCANCWIVSSVQMFESRICQKHSEISLPVYDVIVSEQFITSCLVGPNGYCQWGYPSDAITYMISDGAVPYDCMTYKAPTSISCPASTCPDDSSIDYVNDRYFMEAHDTLTIPETMQQIIDEGPVNAWIQFYSDLVAYSTGIYVKVSDTYRYNHLVIIVGWGTEDGTDYWIVKNSYGPGWGESGFFRIVRGQNECGIESYLRKGTAIPCTHSCDGICSHISSVCSGEGTCDSQDTCTCNTGFYGRYCHTDTPPSCDPECGSHGDCDASECVCDQWWEDGTLPCDTQVCSIDCGEFGTCVIGEGVPDYCDCDGKHTGALCDVSCSLDCGENGACVVQFSVESCDCDEGFGFVDGTCQSETSQTGLTVTEKALIGVGVSAGVVAVLFCVIAVVVFVAVIVCIVVKRKRDGESDEFSTEMTE